MRFNKALLAAMCLMLAGCHVFPEAHFDLSDDSRLPKWFALPPGMSRSDVRVRMYRYADGQTEFLVLDKSGRTIDEARVWSGSVERIYPDSAGGQEYPAFLLYTVNGVSDVIEHKRMEPTFYVSDDPEVWKAVGGH